MTNKLLGPPSVVFSACRGQRPKAINQSRTASIWVLFTHNVVWVQLQFPLLLSPIATTALHLCDQNQVSVSGTKTWFWYWELKPWSNFGIRGENSFAEKI